MIALISAVFIASLLGSMHCAGMCGAFVAFAVTGEPQNQPSRAALNAAYNTGRLVTYTLLGTVAGAFGAAMNLGGSMMGVQRVAAVVAGSLMICFGITTVARRLGASVPRMPVPKFLQTTVAAGHRIAFDLPPFTRALVVGLLTTLLPCGWLYAFAITAAGTGSPVLGAATMIAFWLGTLPVMIAVGIGIQSLTGGLRRHLPLVTSLLIVVVGVWTVIGRVRLPSFDGPHTAPVGDDFAQAVMRVDSLDAEEMPCCHAE